MKLFLFFLIFCIFNLLYLISNSIIFNIQKCGYKKKKYKHITYFDLGSNNGDSILWLFGYKNKNHSYHVPYPFFQHFPTSEVSVHAFEANPKLCTAINENISFLKKTTQNCNFYINCPVAVSNRSELLHFKITSGTLGSSIYYNITKTTKIRLVKIYSVDIINYILQHIRIDDFNILKFDIEGEEYFMIPKLIDTDILKYFDVVYSEFHPKINNPVGVIESQKIYSSFVNYMKENIIPYYEEYNISKELMKIYNNKIDLLYTFRNELFNYKNHYYDKNYIHLK